MRFYLRHAATGGWVAKGDNRHAAPYRLCRDREDAVPFTERDEALSVAADLGSSPTAYEVVADAATHDDAGQLI